MAVTTTNLVLGSARIYSGLVGAVEPVDSLAVPSSAVWTDLGGTKDGVNLTVQQKFANLDVDQIVDLVDQRVTSRGFIVETHAAELTLENLKLAMNGGTVTTLAQVKTFTPDVTNNSTLANYSALIIDGQAPNGKARRIIVRKALVTKDVSFSYKAGDQSVYTLSFEAHYVDGIKSPFVIMDAI